MKPVIMRKNIRTLAIILAAIICIICNSCNRYTVYSAKSQPKAAVAGGLFYALPNTQLKIEVEVEYTNLENAPFADFAEDMLGITLAGKEEPYRIKNISVSSCSTPDRDHYYYVVPRHISVAIDNNNLLRSVGFIPEEISRNNAPKVNASYSAVGEYPTAEYNLYDRNDTFYTRYDSPGKPSMVSSKKDSRSVKQRAISAAERIEEIRTKKQDLIFGDYEGSYSTEALQYLYKKLDDLEEQYLQQFVGEKQIQTQIFYITPQSSKSLIDDYTTKVFRFSHTLGILDTNSSEGELVMCNVKSENNLKQAARFAKYRTGGIFNLTNSKKTFKYREPEITTVTLFTEKTMLTSTPVKVAQFGAIMELPRRRFDALFDSQTGEIIYYKSR